MILSVKNTLSQNLLNVRGYKTNRKIVVFESDDWGAVRMPSKAAYTNLLKHGIKVDKCAYNSFDSLASSEDLNALFELLKKFKDANGQHPMITANAIMANPDFEKIATSDFENYSYELFTETLKNQFPNEHVFGLWSEGMDEQLFYPQFHGREHLNIKRWMRALKANSIETRIAFDNKLFGLSTTITSENRKSYMPAFDFDRKDELSDHKTILRDGLTIFERIFNYKSSSFIAPNYTWHSDLEEVLSRQGVQTIQGARAQLEPNGQRTTVKKHRTGTVNQLNQVYLARNVAFEPALAPNKDWYSSTMSQISNAFFWKTPAIISTHRLNYIGVLDQKNRRNNLRILQRILKNILVKWPSVEFLTSDKLGELILKSNHE